MVIYCFAGKDIQKWLKSCRTTFGRLKRRKSGSADAKMTNRQTWIWRNFQFLKEHIAKKTQSTTLGRILPAASASASTSASASASTSTAASVTASTSSTLTSTGRRPTLQDLDSDEDVLLSPSLPSDPSPLSSKGSKKSRLGQQQQDTLAKLVDVIAESRVGEANLTQQMLGQKQGRAVVWGNALIMESEAITNEWWGAYEAESISLVNKYRHLSQGLPPPPAPTGYPATDYPAAGPATTAHSTAYHGPHSSGYPAAQSTGYQPAQSTGYPPAAHATATVQYPGAGSLQGGRQSATSTGQYLGGAAFDPAMNYETLSSRPNRSITAPLNTTPRTAFGDPDFSLSPYTNLLNPTTPTSQSEKDPPAKD